MYFAGVFVSPFFAHSLIRLMDDKAQASSVDVKELLKPRDVFVRAYVLTGIRLNPKDSNGKSDPYLVARLGVA